VPVGIADLHLESPGRVLWRMNDGGPCRLELFIECGDVLYSDPHPGTRLPLIAFGQVDGRVVPRDAREVVAAPVGVRKAEHVDVVPEAAL
jgi:hypothetical protein